MGTAKRTLLLDTDVLCHQFAFRNTTTLQFDAEAEAVDFTRPDKAKLEVEGYIEELRDTLDCGRVILALSCRKINFRKQLDDTYKAQRVKPKPELWYVIRDFVESNAMAHPVVCYSRLEGDDVLGMMHTGAYRDRSIIASIDKDMKTIPGLYYNPQKPDLGVMPISKVDAHRFHLGQALTGDTTDNYKGCPKVGPKGAAAALDHLDDPLEMWAAVVEVFKSKGLTEDDAIHQARLAFILWDGFYNTSTLKVRLWHPRYLSA